MAREFSIEQEQRSNRSGPVRWIISHALRRPIFPIAMILAAAGNNFSYSYLQKFIGRAFDLITSSGWTNQELIGAAALTMAAALGQGLSRVHCPRG